MRAAESMPVEFSGVIQTVQNLKRAARPAWISPFQNFCNGGLARGVPIVYNNKTVAPA